MATQVSKTFIFPVPTSWQGAEQDDANAGVATYNGPKNLKLWLELDDNNNKTDIIVDCVDPARADYPSTLPANIYAVDLDADEHPEQAAALYGGIAGPLHIEVQAGPSSDPNPYIEDPAHFSEVYDMNSFGWDPSLNSGAGGWKTPRFSVWKSDETIYGWEWVRETRNKMLTASDNRIPEDASESFKAEWKAYRQKLRDIPQDWAGVGTATHLVVWPRDPDMVVQDAKVKQYKETITDPEDPNYYDGVLVNENPDA
tara:strand:+ start:842 stop:1609 length:768 start_codon:yes stop_codon:yes gene_type:complete